MLMTAPKLSISPEKVSLFISKAREFEEQSYDDHAPLAPHHHADEVTFEQLTSFIDRLSDDEKVDMVALMWVGRGDGMVDEWDDLREEATRLRDRRTASYLLARPQLADHLEEALAEFGYA
jgi:Protein of unknown function (DUF3775)